MPRKAARTIDPVALVRLLWHPPTSTGRAGVGVAELVDAAVTLADTEGLDAVTMRRVAGVVGVGAMSVYTYVPGRTELIELMLDIQASRVYAGLELPDTQPDWRTGMEYVSRCNWEHLRKHPWITEIPSSRPILGPGISAKYEAELAPLDGVGLDDVAMDHLLTTVLALTTEAARWQASLERTRHDSGLSDDDWWALAGPALGEAMTDTRLPLASRVGESVSSAGDPEAALRYGLQHLLDGVGTALASS